MKVLIQIIMTLVFISWGMLLWWAFVPVFLAVSLGAWSIPLSGLGALFLTIAGLWCIWRW